ncbi:MAG TPA: hypothetical protein VF794_23900 [Archangium sp.]|jgi:hypothetical protein|uniref:hypothetical protein n=1 Tax=Archangium sp. TaxID=1872627 RepID=UPI002ED9649A
MNLRPTLAALAGLGLGLAVGGWPRPPSRDEEVLRLLQAQARQLEVLEGKLRAPPGEHCTLTLPPGALDTQALRAELARLIKEELRAATAAVPATPEPAAPPPPPSPVQLEARRQVDRLIDAALTSRKWGPTQAEEFRQLLTQLTGPQSQEAIDRLLRTLNSGQIDVQTGGAPF